MSHAGSALLARVAAKTGLTRALSRELAGLKQRQGGHDQGRVICDLAVMLGDGGDCLADLGAPGDQRALFGDVGPTRGLLLTYARRPDDAAQLGLVDLAGYANAWRMSSRECGCLGP